MTPSSEMKAELIRVRMLVSLISRVLFSGCSAEEAGQPLLPGGLGPVRVRPEQVVEHHHQAGETVEGVDPVGGAYLDALVVRPDHLAVQRRQARRLGVRPR